MSNRRAEQARVPQPWMIRLWHEFMMSPTKYGPNYFMRE